MNELLAQLVRLAPGLASGVSGNGPGMQAFLEAYQRTTAMLDQQEMQRQSLSQQQADRQRQIERQNTADARVVEQDRIAAEDRNRRITLEGLQVGPARAGQASALDSPDAAKQFIEQALPSLISVYGDGVMAQGQPAVNMAQQTITARQQRQVREFVDQALKTSFVADNPDSDPVIDQLPAHLQQIVGKPSARLSELQQFAQLPVGKPQGKTRTPPAAGSFEEYSDPATTPERRTEIEGMRKRYMQSDDKPTVQVTLPGGISGKAGDAALKFQDDYARDSKPYITLRDAYQRVQSAGEQPNAAGDLSMIFAYMKMLDPNSVVREQEFANAQNAAGVPDRIRNVYNRVMQGTRLTPEQRSEFLGQAESLFANAVSNQKGVRQTYGDRATKWGIPTDMVLDAEDDFISGKATKRAPAPAFKVGQKVRNKRTGEVREVTGVRPDGSPILGPVVK